jgi:hypothetical protein
MRFVKVAAVVALGVVALLASWVGWLVTHCTDLGCR